MQLPHISQIDRTEEIFESYVHEGDELKLKPTRISVKGWDAQELADIIQRQAKLIEEGGLVIGTYDGDKLIGVASVEKKKRGSHAQYCKMDILYVSAGYRGKHIGKQLLEKCKTIAKGFGVEKLYISATPTKNTIDFYLKNGATLTQELDKKLFALEPLDIHLELRV